MKPITEKFWKYALPTIIGMLLTSINIISDGVFVGRSLGSPGLTSLNLCIPVFSLLIGIGVLTGIGGAAQAGMRLGAGKSDEARQVFSLSLLLTVLLFPDTADNRRPFPGPAQPAARRSSGTGGLCSGLSLHGSVLQSFFPSDHRSRHVHPQ